MEKNLKQNNQDRIGTRLILDFHDLEPIVLGRNIGTKLNLDFPPLEPIFLSNKCDDEILENKDNQKTLPSVRKRKKH